jgi:hypothetical protein
LGGSGEPKWRAALGTGTTASVSRVPRRTLGSGGVEARPVLARGQLRPAPAQAAPTSGTEGVRLLPCKPGELAAYAATAEGRRAVAAVQAWVKAGQTPDEDGVLPVVDDGLAAVAQALLSALADGSGAPGAVLDDALTVGCGTGAVRLIRVQREGKAAQSADEMLRGFALPAGTVLG